MASSISGTVYFRGNAKYDSGRVPAGRIDQFLDDDFGLDTYTLANGTGTTLLNGALQCNVWCKTTKTMTSGSYGNIDLTDGADLDPFGGALIMTTVRLVVVCLSTGYDGVTHYHVGPDNQTHGIQLWFNATSSGYFDDEYGTLIKVAPAAGWAVVDNTTDVLYFKNPNAGSITLNILVAGTR